MNGILTSLVVIGLSVWAGCSVGCTNKEVARYCASVPHAGTICTKDVEEYLVWMDNRDLLCQQVPVCAAAVEQQKQVDARTEELRHEIKLRQEVTESCHCTKSKGCN